MNDFEKNLGDRVWRMQNIYKIRNKSRQVTNLTFNRIQWRILRQIYKQRIIRHFTVKSRQQGVSTFWLLWHLDDTIFNPNTVTGILAHKHESLGYLMGIISLAHRSMPSAVRPKLKDNNKQTLSFVGLNSQIFSSLSIRSIGLHNLHISEWCFCKDLEIGATLGATSTETNISGESTGNGVGNDGYETYHLAKQGESEYQAGFFPWFLSNEYRIPLNGLKLTYSQEEKKLVEYAQKEYNMALDDEQILFRREKKKALKGLFGQEYPETDEDCFMSAGRKFFTSQKIHTLFKESKVYEKTDKFEYDTAGDYVIFHQPIKGHAYAAGADTSEGADDFSCLKIIDVTDRREVFLYHARVGFDTFYKVCDHWCRLYNRALLGVESNNHGHAVLLGLQEDCHYPNLFFTESIQKKKVIGDRPKRKFGWTTNSISRPLMLDQLKQAIEGNEEDDQDHFKPEINIFDRVLLSECLTFEQIKGKYQAAPGKYDDNVFASAIAVQMYLKLRKNFMGGQAGQTAWSQKIYVGENREATNPT